MQLNEAIRGKTDHITVTHDTHYTPMQRTLKDYVLYQGSAAMTPAIVGGSELRRSYPSINLYQVKSDMLKDIDYSLYKQQSARTVGEFVQAFDDARILWICRAGGRIYDRCLYHGAVESIPDELSGEKVKNFLFGRYVLI
jgi:hypothetical protein